MRVFTYIAISISFFAIGWFAHLSVRGEDSPSYHWRKIAEFKKHKEDPEKLGSSMGFSYIAPLFDDTPHLEALTAAGEIEKRTVLIPGLPVSKENTKDWMQFASHPDVLQASAQGDYYDGEVPLSFTIWFRPSFAEAVDNYIKQLHKKANKTAHANPLPAPSRDLNEN